MIEEHIRSLAFTLLVLAAGTAAMYQEGYFTKTQMLNPMIFGDMAMKIVFEGDNPEFLAYAPAEKLSAVPTLTGEPAPDGDTLVLGYSEAKDMSEENKITAAQAIFGYDVDEAFLGSGMTVTGMLKRTGTPMDMMHIVSKERFDSIPPGERIDVKYTEDKMPKFFYYINPDGTNWPKKTTFAMGSSLDYQRFRNEKTVANITLGGLDLHINNEKDYLPLVLGSTEAKMMIDEKIFSKPGDRIDGFFGKNVVIAGVLEPTGTVLDMFHYMPAA